MNRRLSLLSVAAALLVAFGASADAQSGGAIVVSTRGNGEVLVIDPNDGTVVSRIDAGIGLHEIAASSDGRLAVGSAYGSGPRHQTPDRRLCVIDLAGGKVSATIELVTAEGVEHPRPNDLVLLPDARRALVTSEVRDALLEVDVVDGRIIREIPHGVAAGHMLAVTPDRKRAFVPGVRDGAVAAIEVESGKVLATIPTAPGAEGVACSPDGREVWVASNRSDSITVIDAQSLAPVTTFPAAGFPFRVRFSPDGRWVLVSCPQANVVRVYDASTREVRGEIATESAPTSLAIEPAGTRACVVCAGSGRLMILDLESMSVERTIDAGPGADGMAWAPRRADGATETPDAGAGSPPAAAPDGARGAAAHPGRIRIAPTGEPGDALEVTGTVFAPDGTTPAPGVTVYGVRDEPKR